MGEDFCKLLEFPIPAILSDFRWLSTYKTSYSFLFFENETNNLFSAHRNIFCFFVCTNT